MSNYKVSPVEARQILATVNPERQDFDALRQSAVLELLEWADAYGYKAPKTANGSRGRYFHSYLERVSRA
jgi:hypothetical protein